MPERRDTGRIGDRYQLDYYRHPRSTRSWKWRATAVAALVSALVVGVLYGLWGKRAFQAAPVAHVHSGFGNDCRRCHDAAWRPAVRLITADSDQRSVSNASCRECHTSIPDHHGAALNDHGGATPGPACASCHTEHRPEQGLLSVADSHCLSCHSDLTRDNAASGAFAARISGFATGRDPHPEFAILRRGGPEPNSNHRVWTIGARLNSDPEPTWKDAGGLKLNHAVHLAEGGVLGANRKPVKLECADCHEPTADGALMAPVNYEQHCRDCHPLRLAGDFARFGPIEHESPAVIRGWLRERLVNEQNAAGGESEPAESSESDGANEFPTLLPNPINLPADRAQVVDAELDELEHALFGLEAKGFCRKCHHLEPDGDRWQVLMTDPALTAVATDSGTPRSIMPERWFGHATFNHQKHSAAADCTKCHQVAASTATSDVLLPSIDSCRQCHGSEEMTIEMRAGDGCILCHEYHSGELTVHP